MSIMTLIILVLALAIVVVALLAARKPDNFRMERKIIINAPAEKIFAVFNDFHESKNWSPWEPIDPNIKLTFSGAEKGVGAVYNWDGNRDVGSGRQEIISVEPGRRVTIKINFYKPFKAENTVEFTMLPKDGGTETSWAMFGPQPFMGKVVSMFMDCEKMMNDQFDKGLANVKAYVEKQA